MIDTRNPDFVETLHQLEELKFLLEKIDVNIHHQIPQGVTIPYGVCKKDLLNWVEEIEFLITDYLR